MWMPETHIPDTAHDPLYNLLGQQYLPKVYLYLLPFDPWCLHFGECINLDMEKYVNTRMYTVMFNVIREM